jgi:hypothetical protein
MEGTGAVCLEITGRNTYLLDNPRRPAHPARAPLTYLIFGFGLRRKPLAQFFARLREIASRFQSHFRTAK